MRILNKLNLRILYDTAAACCHLTSLLLIVVFVLSCCRGLLLVTLLEYCILGSSSIIQKHKHVVLIEVRFNVLIHSSQNSKMNFIKKLEKLKKRNTKCQSSSCSIFMSITLNLIISLFNHKQTKKKTSISSFNNLHFI